MDVAPFFVDFHHFLSIFTIFYQFSRFTHFCRNLHFVAIYALFPQFFFGQNSLLRNITCFLHVCRPHCLGAQQFQHMSATRSALKYPDICPGSVYFKNVIAGFLDYFVVKSIFCKKCQCALREYPWKCQYPFVCRVFSNFVSVKIFESEKPSLWDSKLNLQRLKELSQATKTIQKNKFPLDSRLESQNACWLHLN